MLVITIYRLYMIYIIAILKEASNRATATPERERQLNYSTNAFVAN